MNSLLETGPQRGRVGQVSSVHFLGVLNKPSFKTNIIRFSASKESQKRILKSSEGSPFATSLNEEGYQRGCPTPLEQPEPLDHSSLQKSDEAIQEVRPSPIFKNRFFPRSKSSSEKALAKYGIQQPTGSPAELFAEISSQPFRGGLKADHSIQFHKRPSMDFNSSDFSEQKAPLFGGDPSFRQPPSRAGRNFLNSLVKSRKRPVLRMKMNTMSSQKIDSKMRQLLAEDSINNLNQRSFLESSQSENNSSSQVSDGKALGQTILTQNIFAERKKLKLKQPQWSLT